jgi:glucosylceramidase
VKVYTTASNTNLRLAVTDNLEFKQTPQPIESEVSIFVNPQKQY